MGSLGGNDSLREKWVFELLNGNGSLNGNVSRAGLVVVDLDLVCMESAETDEGETVECGGNGGIVCTQPNSQINAMIF